MATNKHATIRYQVLNRCFSNTGRDYYIQDLIDECNMALREQYGRDASVSRRQVLEDIKFMESSQGWSIDLERKRIGHRVYLRYENPRFSINNQPLNVTEENQLKEALLTLSRFQGMPQFEWIDELMARLDSGLMLSKKEQHKIIDFEQNPYLQGRDKIMPLYQAILNKQPLNLKYKSYRTHTEKKHIFHPYLLKQYNNRWFIFGYDEGTKEIENFALDRIISILPCTKKYEPNTEIDFEEYFEDIIGVNLPPDEVPVRVIIRVSSQRLPWIQSKPLHGSQKEIDKGKTHTTLSFELIPNNELEALLLSFGSDLEVLEPVKLRASIASKISALNKLYVP